MNRNEEYKLLLSQLEEPPAALDGCVEKARKKARRHRGWETSLASLGGVAAAFVLMVNVSVPFAMACSKIPGLRELTAAVVFSDSLKLAVENDFVQYIGQSQTVEGTTMTVEYVIADKRQVNIFCRFEGDFDYLNGRPRVTNLDGSPLEGYSLYGGGMSQQGELDCITLDFSDRDTPSSLRLRYEVEKLTRDLQELAPERSSGHHGKPTEPEALFSFTFDLELDERMISQGESYPLDQWVELDGQRILLETVDIYPTFIQINLDCDPDNTAYLTGLDFYLEDEQGRQTEHISNGISGRGRTDEPGMSAVRRESSFFWKAKHLTLHIVAADWLDKDRQFATVDLVNGTVEGELPEGVLFGGAAKTSGGLDIAFFAPKTPEDDETHSTYYQIIRDVCYGPEGQEIQSHGSRTTSMGYATLGGKEIKAPDPEKYFAETTYFDPCPYDTVRVAFQDTRRGVTLGQPVSVEIK